MNSDIQIHCDSCTATSTYDTCVGWSFGERCTSILCPKCAACCFGPVAYGCADSTTNQTEQMKPFDPNKPVKTRSGKKATIVSTKGCSPRQPIIALIEDDTGKNYTSLHCVDGSYWREGQVNWEDLINEPEPPKYRAWKDYTEVPYGAMMRFKASTGSSVVPGLVIDVCNAYIKFGKGASVYIANALNECEYSTDGGKTWNVCGILE